MVAPASAPNEHESRKSFVTYTELQRHTTRSSLWVLISGMVYDVTALLSSHPGGAGPLFKYAGKDATWAYPIPMCNFERTDGDHGCAVRSLWRYIRAVPSQRCRPQLALGPSTQLRFLA